MLVWTFSFSSYVPYNMYFTFCFLSYANRLPIERRTHASCQPDWDISDFLLHTKTNFQECCWDSYLRWSLWLTGKNVECVVALGWISPIIRLEITDYDCAMMMQILVNVPSLQLTSKSWRERNFSVTKFLLFFCCLLLYHTPATNNKSSSSATSFCVHLHRIFVCFSIPRMSKQ